MGLKACFGISSLWLRLLALQEIENLFLIFLRFGHLIEFDTTDPHALSPQRLESFHYITKRPLAILALLRTLKQIEGEEIELNEGSGSGKEDREERLAH